MNSLCLLRINFNDDGYPLIAEDAFDASLTLEREFHDDNGGSDADERNNDEKHEKPKDFD